MLLAYAISALLVAQAGWKATFYTGAVSTALMGAVWFFAMGFVERHRRQYGVAEPPPAPAQKAPTAFSDVPFRRVLVASGMLLVALALMLQGVLKDGVTTWVPTYIGETFHLASAVSIISTALLPLCNLLGIFVVSRLYGKVFRSEVTLSLVCFIFSAGCFTLLYFFPGTSVALSLVLLCGATTAMTGVNALMTGVLPVNCAKTGKAPPYRG